MVYTIAAVQERGRVSAHRAVAALGWVSGTQLTMRERGGLVVVTADSSGARAVSRQGYLYLPMAVRRWCGLDVGVRVLVVAAPADERLVIHPLAVLDPVFGRLHQELIGGGRQ